MHEIQTIVAVVRDLCPSVSLSRGSAVCDVFVQPLQNDFGILFCYFFALVILVLL